jgi:hypothetical protein
MMHEPTWAYAADGIRGECSCGWAGPWHAVAHRHLPSRDFAAHYNDAIKRGVEVAKRMRDR